MLAHGWNGKHLLESVWREGRRGGTGVKPLPGGDLGYSLQLRVGGAGQGSEPEEAGLVDVGCLALH